MSINVLDQLRHVCVAAGLPTLALWVHQAAKDDCSQLYSVSYAAATCHLSFRAFSFSAEQ